MSRTLVMLLAGGRGTRLNILGAHRAKPAVPFAGLYRIIDFALSNCMYARFLRVGVLTQYRPVSLLGHLGNGSHWDMDGKTGVLKNLPPFQASGDFDWYHGTADAIRQNLSFIRRYNPERVLILSGDHIYRMDYREMVERHLQAGSAVTVAAMPVPPEETHRFGIIVADEGGRITGFQEKPKVALSNLASMGIYVFEREVLEKELDRAAASGGNDFGQHVLPAMVGRYPMGVYPFRGYWRDVGTIDSYFSASMDLLAAGREIDLYRWRVRTNLAYEGVCSMAPARVGASAQVEDSMLSPGCVVEGRVVRSILSPGVRVGAGAEVVDAIVMHRSEIGPGAVVRRAIIDKHCRIGARSTVVAMPGAAANSRNPDHLSTGLTVVGRQAAVPEGAFVGGNVIIHPAISEAAFPAGGLADGTTLTAPE